jgi:tellurite resistance protein
MPYNVRRSFNEISAEDLLTEQGVLVAELALWSATSDGLVERHELDGIVSTIRQVPGLADFDEGDAESLLEDMAEYDDDLKVTARLHGLAAGITEPGLRRAAFQLAVYCASSDGEFSADETDFLEWLAVAFGFGPEAAETMIREVIP